MATEAGTAVADAVNDLLTAALGGTVCRDPYPPPSCRRDRSDAYDRDRRDDEEEASAHASVAEIKFVHAGHQGVSAVGVEE